MKYVINLIMIFCLISCSDNYIRYYKTPVESTVVRDTLTLFKYYQNRNFEYYKSVYNQKGMKIQSLGYMFYLDKIYQLVPFDNEIFLANGTDIESDCKIFCKDSLKNKSYIILPQDMEDIFWSRAYAYVNNHSDVGIQNYDNFIIRTFTPEDPDKSHTSFVVIKEIMKNNKIKITFKSFNTNPYQLRNDLEIKGCYYVLKGKECY